MHTDVIVVGGSFSGLSAAIYVARSRRRVLVIDAGKPRNRFAQASHGFLGFDGVKPEKVLETARQQLLAYPEARLVSAAATRVSAEAGGFRVDFEGGNAFGERLVLATGVSDELPAIPGLAERWGASVAHCPYCHGYEFGGAPLGLLGATSEAVHHAKHIALWGPATFFTDGRFPLGNEARSELAAAGIGLEEAPIAALEGEGTSLSAVRLADGRAVPLAGLFVTPILRMAARLADDLGCAFEDTPAGRLVRTDAMKQTSVPGVHAVGDMARPMHSVAFAVADGMMAAVAINRERLAA